MMRRDGVREPWTSIGRATKPIIPSKGATFRVMPKQFPLIPAKAITVDKSQGSTLPAAAPHLPLSGRSMYVAFSRATTLSTLFIVGTYRRRLPLRENDFVKLEQRCLRDPANTQSRKSVIG